MSAEAGQSTSQAVQNYVSHHTMDNPNVWHLPFFHIDLPAPLSLHAVMLILAAVFLCLLFVRLYRKRDEVPSGLTNCLEVLVLFVRDEIAIANMGEKDGRQFAPFFCSLFFFILCLNLMGMIPLFSTATANLSVTLALAVVTFAFMVIGGIVRNGPIGFLKSFMPSGVPWPILIILFPIEVIGMFIKPFALMIRLFANMLAGHIVLFSIIGLAVTFGIGSAAPAILMASGIFMLEVFVAFLQAFIFTLLSAMFIGSFLHPEH
ncbi:MAG: F0F1 ATP synthase subunit A [Verrucomicrobia bacterium]|nr:F0F1 ATP synthase subunit A [Verrucomicrobiota bacterium]